MAGRILTDDIEELRQRADLVEVVSAHTQLKKAGRVFKGLCPFHQEKTPSFTVDPDKSLYHCFGCGEGGDVFTFVKEVEALNFGEAAERLASQFGLALRYEKGSKSSGGSRGKLIEVLAIAADFYANLLQTSPAAGPARRHLDNVGFSAEEAQEWGLGFSSSGRDDLYRHLLAKKFTARQIEEAGLVRVDASGSYVDRFRGRLMFPISEVTGSVVGFGARILGGEGPKYLNSPETALYKKSKVLFGLDRARRQIAAEGKAVVAEGYTDVMALTKAGLAAVATCGTALGGEHLSLLKRFCDRVTLAFDADAAGAVASERAFGHHHKLGLEVLVAPFPEGQDPAELALDKGPDAIAGVIAQAIPLQEFRLEARLARERLDTPGGRARAIANAVEDLRYEPNPVIRSQYAEWLARRVGVSPQEVQQATADAGAHSNEEKRPVEGRTPGYVKVEREALALLIASPMLLDEATLKEDHFAVVEHRVLFSALLAARTSGDGGSIMDKLPDEGARRMAASLALTPSVTRETTEVFSRLDDFRVSRLIDELRAKLDQLDPKADEYADLFKELMKLESDRHG